MIASAVVSQPYLRASIYDVRTEGGGGSNNAPNLRSKRVDFADGEGLGDKKSQISVDLMYGSPLGR